MYYCVKLVGHYNIIEKKRTRITEREPIREYLGLLSGLSGYFVSIMMGYTLV